MHQPSHAWFELLLYAMLSSQTPRMHLTYFPCQILLFAHYCAFPSPAFRSIIPKRKILHPSPRNSTMSSFYCKIATIALISQGLGKPRADCRYVSHQEEKYDFNNQESTNISDDQGGRHPEYSTCREKIHAYGRRNARYHHPYCHNDRKGKGINAKSIHHRKQNRDSHKRDYDDFSKHTDDEIKYNHAK